MDAESRDRQFWLRVLLVVGLLFGMMPIITIPLVFIDGNVSILQFVAVVFNAATVLPACAVAFWRRRTACIWLSIDAVLLAAELSRTFRVGGQFAPEVMIGMVGSIVVALCLDFIEIKHWPEALAK